MRTSYNVHCLSLKVSPTRPLHSLLSEWESVKQGTISVLVFYITERRIEKVFFGDKFELWGIVYQGSESNLHNTDPIPLPIGEELRSN